MIWAAGIYLLAVSFCGFLLCLLPPFFSLLNPALDGTLRLVKPYDNFDAAQFYHWRAPFSLEIELHVYTHVEVILNLRPGA
jgi:hypothetical protein